MSRILDKEAHLPVYFTFEVGGQTSEVELGEVMTPPHVVLSVVVAAIHVHGASTRGVSVGDLQGIVLSD